MKKNTFALGALSGMSILALAFPIAAQISSAQGIDEAAPSEGTRAITFPFRGPMTQEDLQARIDKDTALLGNIDAIVALHKSAIQTRLTALSAAIAIDDATARQEAIHAADEEFRATIHAAMEANPDLHFGMHMGFGKGPHGFRGHRFGPGDLAAKLGMTEEEFKAEIDAGKTIEHIAEEQGIELPARPAFPFGGHMRGEAPAAE
jgi:hypothetical protein